MTTHTPASRLVIGNWKCTKTRAEAEAWLAAFGQRYEPVAGVAVAVAPPMILLAPLADYLARAPLPHFSLVAQDVSPFPPGPYTGATAAAMLKPLCRFVIVGHSERRRYFHETAQDAVNKVSEAADAGITPIICVDEKNALSQLTALGGIDCDDLVIAYSPVDAPAYREPQDPEKVAEIVSYIGQVYPTRPLIYGGGVTSGNCERYGAIPGISGLFVGSASLDAASFAQIVRSVQQSAPPRR